MGKGPFAAAVPHLHNRLYVHPVHHHRHLSPLSRLLGWRRFEMVCTQGCDIDGNRTILIRMGSFCGAAAAMTHIGAIETARGLFWEEGKTPESLSKVGFGMKNTPFII